MQIGAGVCPRVEGTNVFVISPPHWNTLLGGVVRQFTCLHHLRERRRSPTTGMRVRADRSAAHLNRSTLHCNAGRKSWKPHGSPARGGLCDDIIVTVTRLRYEAAMVRPSRTESRAAYANTWEADGLCES